MVRRLHHLERLRIVRDLQHGHRILPRQGVRQDSSGKAAEGNMRLHPGRERERGRGRRDLLHRALLRRIPQPSRSHRQDVRPQPVQGPRRIRNDGPHRGHRKTPRGREPVVSGAQRLDGEHKRPARGARRDLRSDDDPSRDRPGRSQGLQRHRRPDLPVRVLRRGGGHPRGGRTRLPQEQAAWIHGSSLSRPHGQAPAEPQRKDRPEIPPRPHRARKRLRRHSRTHGLRGERGHQRREGDSEEPHRKGRLPLRREPRVLRAQLPHRDQVHIGGHGKVRSGP